MSRELRCSIVIRFVIVACLIAKNDCKTAEKDSPKSKCENGRTATCENAMAAWFAKLNDEMAKFDVLTSNVAWKMTVEDGDEELSREAVVIGTTRSEWRANVCDEASAFSGTAINVSQRRQLYLLCRGAFFTFEEIKMSNDILNEMQSIYSSSKVCIKVNKNFSNSSAEEQIYQYLLEVHSQNMKTNQKNNYHYKNLKLGSRTPFDLSIWKDVLSKDTNQDSDLICFSGEPDLQNVMTKSKIEDVLKWTWLAWRQAVGPSIKPLFERLVVLENRAANRKGYSDIGEVWREELEIVNLEELADKLYDDVKHLYELLHAVLSHFLTIKYGFSNSRLIEAHLTGNMWGQSWENTLDIILPISKNVNLNYVIKKTNWTSRDMVKRAEDFYVSLGLPSMTDEFWKYSHFGSDKGNNKDGKCHGTAANMYKPNDYRMIYCADLSMEDFYVIHHELGHIQYYMSYDKKLPAIFMDGTNSAFQESIGDAIMLAVMAPQHLLRLGLIDDQMVYVYPSQSVKKMETNYNIASHKNESGRKLDKPDFGNISFDDILLLYQGLSKIPQVPFGYIIDKYRWDIFSKKIKPTSYNTIFWNYVMQYQGLTPPNNVRRSEEYFDAAAKYHIPDNTPYIRYFLSSFIQVQIFKGMCQMSLFGSVDPQRHLPMPLHRCDIYGTKKIGRKLQEVVSKGSSIHWSEALYNLTGERTISSKPFLEYFKPLEIYLRKLIKQHNIVVGW